MVLPVPEPGGRCWERQGLKHSVSVRKVSGIPAVLWEMIGRKDRDRQIILLCTRGIGASIRSADSSGSPRLAKNTGNISGVRSQASCAYSTVWPVSASQCHQLGRTGAAANGSSGEGTIRTQPTPSGRSLQSETADSDEQNSSREPEYDAASSQEGHVCGADLSPPARQGGDAATSRTSTAFPLLR